MALEDTRVLRLCATREDVEPTVLRRIEVPEAMRPDRLHLVLQAAIPWQNYHLWEFRAGDTCRGLPNPDCGENVRPAANRPPSPTPTRQWCDSPKHMPPE